MTGGFMGGFLGGETGLFKFFVQILGSGGASPPGAGKRMEAFPLR